MRVFGFGFANITRGHHAGIVQEVRVGSPSYPRVGERLTIVRKGEEVAGGKVQSACKGGLKIVCDEGAIWSSKLPLDHPHRIPIEDGLLTYSYVMR